MKKIIVSFIVVGLLLSTSLFANTLNLSVKGMHCGGCETKFKSLATSIAGVTEVKSASAANSSAVIEYDEKVISSEKLITSLAEKTGYTIANLAGNNAAVVSGKPAGCCQKGQSNPACKKGEEASKCTKSKEKCSKSKSASKCKKSN